MAIADVMIDTETLGVTADAAIISIGAVKFDPYSDDIADEAFYASISIESNLDKGRRIDEPTMIWWMQQDVRARIVFTEPKIELGEALDSLAAWISDENSVVWSNGADFDIPMLAHAYRSFNWLPPWKFWNVRCFRTMNKLPLAASIPYEKSGVKHNALDDAINQAKRIQTIYSALEKKK